MKRTALCPVGHSPLALEVCLSKRKLHWHTVGIAQSIAAFTAYLSFFIIYVCTWCIYTSGAGAGQVGYCSADSLDSISPLQWPKCDLVEPPSSPINKKLPSYYVVSKPALGQAKCSLCKIQIQGISALEISILQRTLCLTQCVHFS